MTEEGERLMKLETQFSNLDNTEKKIETSLADYRREFREFLKEVINGPEGIMVRLDRLEHRENHHRRQNLTSGGAGAGLMTAIVALLKLLGWL